MCGRVFSFEMCFTTLAHYNIMVSGPRGPAVPVQARKDRECRNRNDKYEFLLLDSRAGQRFGL